MWTSSRPIGSKIGTNFSEGRIIVGASFFTSEKNPHRILTAFFLLDGHYQAKISDPRNISGIWVSVEARVAMFLFLSCPSLRDLLGFGGWRGGKDRMEIAKERENENAILYPWN